MAAGDPDGKVRFQFRDKASIAGVDDPIHRDVSAIAGTRDWIYLACDETAGVDLVQRDGDGFSGHEHQRLGDFFDLPGGDDGEMDIEGLDAEEGWLWIVGSQSLTRGKPGNGDDVAAKLDALAAIDWDCNRQFLGRVPLVQGQGVPRPARRDGDRRAASLKFTRHGKLRKWLKRDRHIGPFLDTPSKENGFDVEGIAALGTRVFLGLRGPVFRRHAVILELDLKIIKRTRLKARRIAGRRRYRKHFVDTQGQGIRDVKRDGADLLILTGTVMAGDGPSEVLRLPGLTERGSDSVWSRDEAVAVREMPYRGIHDHPEGLMRWDDGRWLVVYDSPAPERVSDDPPWVEGDIWRF